MLRKVALILVRRKTAVEHGRVTAGLGHRAAVWAVGAQWLRVRRARAARSAGLRLDGRAGTAAITTNTRRAWLERAGRKAGTRNNTLARAVETDAQSLGDMLVGL